MCIPIVYFSGCDIINFEINLIFLIKLLLFLDDQKFKKKIKYLENKKSSSSEIENIFYHS